MASRLHIGSGDVGGTGQEVTPPFSENGAYAGALVSRHVRKQMALGNGPSDEMLQIEARRILYDSTDN